MADDKTRLVSGCYVNCSHSVTADTNSHRFSLFRNIVSMQADVALNSWAYSFGLKAAIRNKLGENRSLAATAGMRKQQA